MNTNDLNKIIKILRNATTAVKIAPFVFAFCYIICISSYILLNENVSMFADMIFYISPMTVAFCLVLSRIFKLCKWHRLECSLPLFSMLSVIIDEFIYNLDSFYLWLNWGLVISLLALSLINAYFVFIKPLYNETNRS